MGSVIRWRNDRAKGSLTLRHTPESNPNFALGLGAFQGYLNGMQSPASLDLIRIAAVVYVADTSIRRSTASDVVGDGWARDLRFRIPVLEPDKWNHVDVRDQLVRTLTFLTGDEYSFEFEPWVEPTRQEYLKLFETPSQLVNADCVSLFSGGIDSLVAVAQLLGKKRRPLLISHRSSTRLGPRRKELLQVLDDRMSTASPHWQVEIRRVGNEAAERTQRSRAFLYAALGAGAAISLTLPEVFICDNGITSANLVYSLIAQGSEATRSTHPRFLADLNRLLGMISDAAPTVRNTLAEMTKGDVTKWLADNSLGDLLPLTTSCARTHMTTKALPHCGTCSQCIDRRFAAIWARLGDDDTGYQTDIFTQPIPAGADMALAEGYVRFAGDIHDRSPDYFVSQFPSVYDLSTNPDEAGTEVMTWIDLHAKHASQVLEVYATQTKRHAAELARGELPAGSLLRVIPATRHEPIERAIGFFRKTLPKAVRTAFASTKPTNEEDLQNKIQAILLGHKDSFEREHPAIRFLGKAFVPDFSPKLRPLFIEVKYPRKPNRTATRIAEEMAADLTASRAAQQPILFVIYDPENLMKEASDLQRDLAESDAGRAFVIVVR